MNQLNVNKEQTNEKIIKSKKQALSSTQLNFILGSDTLFFNKILYIL